MKEKPITPYARLLETLRDMTEADFDKAHGITPAGVPDVAALVDWLRWKYSNIPDVMKAATALAALQANLCQFERSNIRLEHENAQQAERINELRAKLAAAAMLLAHMLLYPDQRGRLLEDAREFLNKYREVMR